MKRNVRDENSVRLYHYDRGVERMSAKENKRN